MATILSLDSVSSQFHTNSRMPSRNTAFVELTPYFVQSDGQLHRHVLLHEEVQILRDERSKTFLLEETQELDGSEHL